MPRDSQSGNDGMESGMGRRNERALAIVRVLAQLELVQLGAVSAEAVQLEGGCSICAFIRSRVEFI
jgi:hypothetical protein